MSTVLNTPSTTRKFWGKLWESSIAVLVIVILWEALPSLGIIWTGALPPLSAVLKALWTMTINGMIWHHFSISIFRSLSGFVLACAVGLPLGLLLGRSKLMFELFDPLIVFCRNTAVLALYPVFILIFGFAEFSKIAIIFWGAIWPILLNTMDGVRKVDPILIKAAKSMSISEFSLFRKVILPYSLPAIYTGFRLSATRAVVILVAAEMLGARAGLGFLVFSTQNSNLIPEMYAAILVLIALGLTLNSGLTRLEKKATFWKPANHEVT